MEFIIICIVVFIFVVLLFNFQNIKSSLASKTKKDKVPKKKEKIDYDTAPKQENVSYDEKDFKKHATKVVDDLNRDDLSFEPFVNISEDELSELSDNQKDFGGRKYKVPEQKEQDFDFYEDDFEFEVENSSDLHDIFDSTDENAIAEEIKHLSPELKAILISDLLKRKEDI